MRNLLDRFFKDKIGSLAAISAVAAVPLLLVAGTAVEYSQIYFSKSKVQDNLDTLVTAGARGFLKTAEWTPSKQEAHVKEIMQEMIDNWDPAERNIAIDDLEFEIDTDKKKILVRGSTTTKTSLLQLAGFDEITTTLVSEATATLFIQPVCILALDKKAKTGITFDGNGELFAQDCVVWSNSRSNQSIKFYGNGSVLTNRLCAAGRAGVPGQFSVLPSPEEDCITVRDPFDRWKAPKFGDCTNDDVEFKEDGPVVLKPGVYCGGLKVEAGSITMSPGIYVIKDGPLILKGSSTISGTGVGILLSGDDTDVEIDGATTVQISSDKNGKMPGILLAADDSVEKGVTSIIGRSDLQVGGVMYLPKHKVIYRGESDTEAASPVTTLIAATIEIGGDAFLKVRNDIELARYAPPMSTGEGTISLTR